MARSPAVHTRTSKKKRSGPKNRSSGAISQGHQEEGSECPVASPDVGRNTLRGPAALLKHRGSRKGWGRQDETKEGGNAFLQKRRGSEEERT